MVIRRIPSPGDYLGHGIKLFDTHTIRGGATLFFLDAPWGRSNLVVKGGHDLANRFFELLDVMVRAKELGGLTDGTRNG